MIQAGKNGCYNSMCSIGIIMIRTDLFLGMARGPPSVRGSKQNSYDTYGLQKVCLLFLISLYNSIRLHSLLFDKHNNRMYIKHNKQNKYMYLKNITHIKEKTSTAFLTFFINKKYITFFIYRYIIIICFCFDVAIG